MIDSRILYKEERDEGGGREGGREREGDTGGKNRGRYVVAV
jgi:hypothetical protein